MDLRRQRDRWRFRADYPRSDLIDGLFTRRDADIMADSVTIAFGSYHDRRTAYSLQLSVAQRAAL